MTIDEIYAEHRGKLAREAIAIRASGAWVHFDPIEGCWCAMRHFDGLVYTGQGATVQEAIAAVEPKEQEVAS